LIPYLFRPFLSVKVPVYRDASLATEINELQPIFFSHGLSVHRMCYSALYMELASCGYCVVALTHGDGSADYHPVYGTFEDNFKIADYKARNSSVKVREQELKSLVNDF